MRNKAFLQLVAEDMHQVFSGNYADVTVVFPNKRASLFMNGYLATMADDGPLWTPNYTTISELFEQMSELVVADPMYLVCRLYQAYKQCTGSDETLDHFYAWGELMLSDFEDIDNNMVDAEKLFTNIADMENLSVTDYLSEQQVEALQSFFYDFNPPKAEGDAMFKSTLRQNFSTLWNKLFDIYTTFRNQIASEGKCYSGMLKRSVIETRTSQAESVFTTTNYVVVGFNVLNETEKQMFRLLKKSRNTLFYWDYDDAYLSTDVGMFIRDNMNLFPNQFSGRNLYSNLKSDVKKITYISSPTEDAQSRYVNKWLAQEDVSCDHNSAIVLCNEKMLNSVLHSIPSTIDDDQVYLNVTMGFPLCETPVYSFICSLLDLQIHGRTSSSNWRYTSVANVLKHPYTKRLTEGRTVLKLKEMQAQSMMFPKDTFFADDEVLRKIFTPCKTPHTLTQYLSEIVELVAKCGDESPIFVESVYSAQTMINRLGTIQETMPEFSVNKITYGRLLRQLLKGRSAPFHGEPAIGLQVMGLLETRNLDFKNVIMMSVNEGQIPKVSMNNSFIPYTLRQAYGMTTIEKQTSLYAYYFYRLIQRAENITLMYNCSTEGLVKGEKSRFMMQLQVEAKDLLAPGTKIELRTLTSDKDVITVHPIEINSSKEIVNILRRRYDLAFERNPEECMMLLSPSAINRFISCRRQFFYQYVAKLKVEKEITEEVDASTFGTIFHRCMEKLYRQYEGKQLQKGFLYQLAADRQRIEYLVDEAFAVEFFKLPADLPSYDLPYNGSQLLDKHVLMKQVVSQLKYDAQYCPFTVKKVEDTQYTIITVPTSSGDIRVRIGGIIDRYDLIDDAVMEPGKNQLRIRVVDYKTSSKMQKAKVLADLFTPKKDRPSYYLQTLYYCETLADSAELPIYPHLMYVAKPLRMRETSLDFDKTPVRDYVKEYRDDFMALLKSTIADIFDEHTSFTMTDVSETCAYCDFKELCGKE